MRKILFILILFSAFPAKAATFVSVEEYTGNPTSIIWNYVYSVKGSDVPLNVVEYSCFKMKRGQRLKIEIPEGSSWVCHDDEASARPEAQKKADQFESNLAKFGHG